MRGCNSKDNPCKIGFIRVKGGQCEQSCQIDQHCTKGQYCHEDHRVCYDFCQIDNDCSVGYICHENGECLKECFDQDDCNENQLCDR